MDPLSIDAVMGRSTGRRPNDPLARLGRAVMLLSQELATCRREIAELSQENTKLRGRLGSHPSDVER
jgi:hypothetical protein